MKFAAFIITNPFPKGLASTNRIISLAKGLCENGIRVKVICIMPSKFPTSENNLDYEYIGVYNGIEFEYSAGTANGNKKKLIKLYLYIVGILKSFLLILRENKRQKIDSFFVSFDTPLLIIYYYLLSRITKSLYIFHRDEYPFKLIHKSRLRKFYKFLIYPFIFKFYDGMLIMTKPLEKYFNNKKRKKAKIIIIPMTVEVERFNIDKNPNDEKYIAYCGSLRGNKDGIDILIKSFQQISNKYPNFKLYLAGTSNKEDLIRLKKLSKNLGINDKVVFTGVLSRDEVPEFLCNATILALARPCSLQAEGGFPSKVGEYLATGNVVVVTDTGTITDYMEDDLNIIISKPDSVEEFASKLDYALSNPKKSKIIGEKGKDAANTFFNYKVQAIEIIKFVNSIKR